MSEIKIINDEAPSLRVGRPLSPRPILKASAEIKILDNEPLQTKPGRPLKFGCGCGLKQETPVESPKPKYRQLSPRRVVEISAYNKGNPDFQEHPLRLRQQRQEHKINAKATSDFLEKIKQLGDDYSRIRFIEIETNNQGFKYQSADQKFIFDAQGKHKISLGSMSNSIGDGKKTNSTIPIYMCGGNEKCQTITSVSFEYIPAFLMSIALSEGVEEITVQTM